MFEKTNESERMLIYLLRQVGWTVQSSIDPENYRFEIIKPVKRVAVQIREQRRRTNVGQLENFINFLDRPESSRFTRGLYISTRGFSPSVYSFLREEEFAGVDLAILNQNEIIWEPEAFDAKARLEKPLYIGVFTSKGGVGKTTISAHLAGAFAVNGYDVALVDLDRQENLRKILGDGVHIPRNGDVMGSVVSVFNRDEWDEDYYKTIKIVVCDCSPEFEVNPRSFVERFDYCIIPTTLNPLGINKNGDVIKRTLELIRQRNHEARLFVLINSLQKAEENRNILLNYVLKNEFHQHMRLDDLCHYIDPSEVAIRFSKQLLYWGFHLFEEKRPELAFNKIGRYSYPRVDFLKLVDYLEDKTAISIARKNDQT